MSTDQATDATEVDDLRYRVGVLQADNIRLRDETARRYRTDREWEQRIVSARRREWEDRLGAAAELHLRGEVDRLEQPIGEVLYRISQLPDRPDPRQMGGLRAAADRLRRLRRDPDRSDPIAVLKRYTAEAVRLRGYIVAAGRRLHDASGRDALGCTCDGCQLIIGMDVDGGDEPAPCPDGNTVNSSERAFVAFLSVPSRPPGCADSATSHLHRDHRSR